MKLEIKNLSFSYKNKEILNNISFEVYSGTLLSYWEQMELVKLP